MNIDQKLSEFDKVNMRILELRREIEKTFDHTDNVRDQLVYEIDRSMTGVFNKLCK